MAIKTISEMSAEELEEIYLREDDGDSASKRIRALVKKLATANEAREVAEAKVEEVRAAAAEEAAKTAREEADAEWGAKLTAREEDLALSRLEINDDDTIHLLRRHHATLPEESRPTLAEWAKSLQESEDARKDAGISATLAGGLGIKTGGAPDISGGTSDPKPLTEEAIQAAFAKGSDGFAGLLSTITG